MAATETKPPAKPIEPRNPLTALSMAAAVLPGLCMPSTAHAEADNSTGFQYGHYREGERDLGGLDSKFRPITADSILGSVRFTRAGDLTGVVNFSEDAWSGATPVATAPSSARGNRVSTTHVMTGASIDGMHGGHGGHEEADPGAPAPATLTGASPYLYTALKLDAARQPLRTDADGAVTDGRDTQLVHTLSSASPEIRRQVDLTVAKELEEMTLEAGAGISREPDYESLFGHLGASLNLDQRLATLSARVGYATGDTQARLDHDAVPHIYEPYMYTYERRGDETYNQPHDSSRLALTPAGTMLYGKREDLEASLGYTRVINRGALFSSSLDYTRSSGYLSNPYKAVEVAFIDPLHQDGQAGGNTGAAYVYDATLVALLEQRPDLRNQGSLSLRYVQHIAASDAALHLGYRWFQDDWNIRAHTLDLEWIQPVGSQWMIAPRLSYYSQSAADFYTPWLVTDQGLYSYVSDPLLGPLYFDARDSSNATRYYEDQTGTVTPPIDTNPSSPKFGLPVTGPNGGAVINQQTGQPVDNQVLVNALEQDTVPFDRSKLPTHYSSDARLADYGTLGAGLTISRQIGKSARLEFGYEYLRRASRLKFGGGDDTRYADVDSQLFNLALTLDLDGTRRSATAAGDGHAGHAHHGAATHAPPAPAGVMFDHALGQRGDFMVGYRYMHGWQSGNIRHGNDNNRVDDHTLINKGCQGQPCYVRPTDMTMGMHMLDIMFAPTDWLTVMLMPQFVEMEMSRRLLDGSPRTGGMDPLGMAITHAEHPHTTAGLGDTGLHALFRLYRSPGASPGVSPHTSPRAEILLGLGVSIPTGDVDLRMRPMMGNDMGFMDYGMQTGSGTWDFKPSLTYAAHRDAWSWGSQFSGSSALGARNASGYALGDNWQATAWASRALDATLSTSLRGVFTHQDAIDGAFNGTHVAIGPGDYPQNYGGEFIDIGLGLSATGSGNLAAHRWRVEWLQPAHADYAGYQLAREGTLVFSWDLHL